MDLDAADVALRGLIDTINATGGLFKSAAGEYCPVADEDWPDLATVYLDACRALGIEPQIEESHT